MKKNSIISGQIVFFFLTKREADDVNNGSLIAPATIVGRPWSDGTVNLNVQFDKSIAISNKSSISKASSLENALTGYKWATQEQCESWGIDLSDAYQDIDAILNETGAPADVKSEENSAHGHTEGSEVSSESKE